MKVVIDSSVFISSLGEKDIYTTNSRLVIKKLATQNILVPTLVIAETLTILQKQGNSKIKEIFDYLISFELINLDSALIGKMLTFLKSIPFKTSDTIIVLTTKIYNATLVTWDKQLLKSAGDICSITTPSDYISRV